MRGEADNRGGEKLKAAPDIDGEYDPFILD